MQANGNSFPECCPPTCWALRNENCLLAFLIYEETIRPGWLTLTMQVSAYRSGGEEPLEAAAYRVPLCSKPGRKLLTLERGRLN